MAQDAPSQIGPVVPQASSCTVDPRTTDELIALFATATPDDPVVIDMTATIVVGETADPVSAQHVTVDHPSGIRLPERRRLRTLLQPPDRSGHRQEFPLDG